MEAIKDFNSANIRVINTEHEYNRYMDEIEEHCNDYNVLGVGAVWVHDSLKCPVPLIQLATANGLILLIRTCKMKTLPAALKKLLENKNILKVGCSQMTEPLDTAAISRSYNVSTKSTLDLMFLLEDDYYHGMLENFGLYHPSVGMVVKVINRELRVPPSSWEDEKLGYLNVQHTAKYAFSSIELFKVFMTPHNASLNYTQLRALRPWINREYYPFATVNERRKALEIIPIKKDNAPRSIFVEGLKFMSKGAIVVGLISLAACVVQLSKTQ